jgi:hypothetical protein
MRKISRHPKARLGSMTLNFHIKARNPRLTASALPYHLVRRQLLLENLEAANQHASSCCTVSTTSITAPSLLMARTFAISSWIASANILVLYPRTLCYSMLPLCTTCSMRTRRQPSSTCMRQQRLPIFMTASWHSRTNMIQKLGREVLSYLGESASG